MPSGNKAGRRHKPTALKILEGNPGKRPLNKDEPKPKRGIPESPFPLDDDAQEEWDRISQVLDEMGVLTKADGLALAHYCQQHSIFINAQRQMDGAPLVITTATGHPMPNPLLAIKNKAQEQIRRFLIEFGLTPAARAKISVQPKTENNEFESF